MTVGRAVVAVDAHDKRDPGVRSRQGFLDAMCANCPDEQPLVLFLIASRLARS